MSGVEKKKKQKRKWAEQQSGSWQGTVEELVQDFTIRLINVSDGRLIVSQST